VCLALTAGKNPPFCVPMRISFGAASARARDDSAATAADPSDNFKNCRRFIAISCDDARAVAQAPDARDDGGASTRCRALAKKSDIRTVDTMITAIFISAGGAIARKNFLHAFARLEHFEADLIPVSGFGADASR
jgi:hypothetical protein